MSHLRGELTRMLRGVVGGGRRSADELLPLVYEELRSLARAKQDGAGAPGADPAGEHQAHEHDGAVEAWSLLNGIPLTNATWISAQNMLFVGRRLLAVGFYEEAEKLLAPGERTVSIQIGAENPDTLAARATLGALPVVVSAIPTSSVGYGKFLLGNELRQIVTWCGWRRIWYLSGIAPAARRPHPRNYRKDYYSIAPLVLVV